MKIGLNDLYEEKNTYKIGFADSWYHISKKNSIHGPHNHANCSWCGIYYLDSGDENQGGKTIFLSPIQSNFSDIRTYNAEHNLVRVTPTSGLLIIFPSYLYHYQELYTGNKDRVVVAFNSVIMEVQ